MDKNNFCYQEMPARPLAGQKANGLVADGLIGAKTKAKMNASVR